jgi:hypothetical protein
MKQGKIIESNFKETIKRSLDNTLNFENHTIYEKYDYEDENKRLGSSLNICLGDNYILNVVVPYLRSNSPIEFFRPQESALYEYRPMKLSYAKYGVIDFWWILLSVNGYFNPIEFHSFEYLIIPNKNDLAAIIDKELYTNKGYGVIPE